MKAKEFGETLAAQHSGFSFSVYSQYCNLTAWVEEYVVYFTDKDYNGDTKEYIAAKTHDKKRKQYYGFRKVYFRSVM